MLELLAAHDSGAGACGALFIFGIFGVIALVSKLAANAAANDFDRVRQSGKPALGIILRIEALGTTTTGTPTRFSGMTASGSWTWLSKSVHRRNARIDVEIPGQPPYEVTTGLLMPLNMSSDVLPGSSVELRIDPKDPKKIIVVGPGSGFAGFAPIPVTFQQDGSA